MELSLTNLGLLCLGGFIVSALAVPVVRRLALKLRIVATPTGCWANSEKTALLGGIAVFTPFAVVFVAFFTLEDTGILAFETPDRRQMLSLFLGVLWILGLGTWDDKSPLSWKMKLLGQIAGALILVLGGHTLTNATLPLFGFVEFGWLGVPCFILGVVIITNAINLVDGLDGLAGGICLFAALTCGIIAFLKGDGFAAVMGFTMAGSILGFLFYNFPPASIFLGDGGSMALGFFLGCLSISSAAMFPGQRLATGAMILIPFLPFLVPLYEVAISVVRRWCRGQDIFVGDMDHLHHRLVMMVGNPRRTVIFFYLLSADSCALAILLAMQADCSAVSYMAAIMTLPLFAGILGSMKMYRVGDFVPFTRMRQRSRL